MIAFMNESWDEQRTTHLSLGDREPTPSCFRSKKGILIDSDLFIDLGLMCASHRRRLSADL